ncbi:putative non-specific serine/threonine protein kinase [Helianthus anomalus]
MMMLTMLEVTPTSVVNTSDITYGVMNDTCSFVIVENSLNKIWESFDSPAHTMLPTQSIKRGGGLTSIMSETNYSGGRFQVVSASRWESCS